MSRLEQLRDSLGAEPSRPAWDAVTAIFDDWPDQDDLAVGLDYAREHLAPWPPALRRTPQAWLEVLMGGPKNAQSARKWKRGEREHPALSLCTHLDFVGAGVTRRKLSTTRRIDHLGHVSHITARMMRPDGPTGLGGLPLPPPTHIDLAGSVLQDGLAGLANLDLTRLRALDLRDCVLNASGVAGFFEAASMPALETLKLSRNAVGPPLAVALSEASLPSLEVLELSECGLHGEAGAHIARMRSPLRSLDIGLNDLGAAGIGALAGAPLLAHLEALNIEGVGLDLESLTRLVNVKIPDLTRLSLGYNDLGVEELGMLAKMGLSGLTTLELQDAGLDDDTIEALDLRAIPALEHLDLRWNKITIAGQGAMGERQARPGLTIDFGYNPTRLD